MGLLSRILERLGGREEEECSSYEEYKSEHHIAAAELFDVSNCTKDNATVFLNVLSVADSHGKLMQKDLKNTLYSSPTPDIVVLLGDNAPDDLEAVLDVLPEDMPIYGVEGNHDEKGVLQRYNRILDVNGRCIASSPSCVIGGLSGSIKYKDSDYYAMLTNEESEQVMKNMPHCDILITHDKPCFELPDVITAHSGLTGIGKYIQAQSPHIVLHGHLHDRYIKRYRNTIIRCCYGVEAFTIAF